MSCDSCHQMWWAASGAYLCGFGHWQQVEYVQAIVQVEHGDEIVLADGQLLYALKSSGVLVIGYYDPVIRAQPPQPVPPPPLSQPASKGFIEASYAQILQLSEHYTIEDIRQNRKRLLTENHPDKVNHLGKAIQETAEQETRKINEAYSYFERKLNIK